MANANRVILVGRLTRDPETKELQNGGKVAKFGFCVNGRKKKGDEWVDDPMFIDVEAWNRGNYNLADNVEKYLSKGSSAYIEGRLQLDQWEKDGEKKSKHKVVVDTVQFLDSKKDREGDGDDEDRPRRSRKEDAAEEELPF
jgi:single-strand DNA-binding protein